MHGTKIRQRMKKGLALLLAAVLVTAFAGCGSEQYIGAEALIEPGSSSSGTGLEPLEINETFELKYLDFAVEMFQLTRKSAGKTMAVSPLSVMFALGMAENGASGETLAQMEEKFGFSRDVMNRYLATLLSEVNGNEGLRIADSVWLRDSFADSVKKEYLQMCANAYRAGVFKAPFDQSTVDDINLWIKNNTDGMIEKMLNDGGIPGNLVLVNAVLFDQKWADPFDKEKTEKGAAFYDASGTKTGTVDLMTETYSGSYYQDEWCTQVRKSYKDGYFSFSVYQPREGVTVEELLAQMSSQYLYGMNGYGKRHEAKITLQLPKFTSEYFCDNMADILMEMGFTAPFSTGLDSISDDRVIVLGEVLHKTKVEVDEEGTKAAAATIMMEKAAAPMDYPDEITVRLDRPFIYTINYQGIPIFLGTYEG